MPAGIRRFPLPRQQRRQGGALEARQTTDDDWDASVDLKLGSVFRMSGIAIDRLASGGNIVNIASAYGVTGFRNGAHIRPPRRASSA
ncbi:SDR family NAD(P)-dependent oxidoreductase [Devosia sp. UYZn731]|uniref:SDR family NAD(P)-dependent oxidoreductase n=1 Tax=Devosia sp. UYZn731 TaxID=3156345 RepID=UPI00339A54BC